jgi:hypothetical protein
MSPHSVEPVPKQPKELEAEMPNPAMRFERLEQQRIATFLKKTNQELDRLGLWNETLTLDEAKANGLLSKSSKSSGHANSKGFEKLSEKQPQMKPSS